MSLKSMTLRSEGSEGDMAGLEDLFAKIEGRQNELSKQQRQAVDERDRQRIEASAHNLSKALDKAGSSISQAELQQLTMGTRREAIELLRLRGHPALQSDDDEDLLPLTFEEKAVRLQARRDRGEE